MVPLITWAYLDRGCNAPPAASLHHRGVFGTVFARAPPSPPCSSFFPPRGPYGAVCFVRHRAPLASNYRRGDGATSPRLVALKLLRLLGGWSSQWNSGNRMELLELWGSAQCSIVSRMKDHEISKHPQVGRLEISVGEGYQDPWESLESWNV